MLIPLPTPPPPPSSSPPQPTPHPPLPLRLLTHNIRYATPHPSRGEKPWPTRAPRLISQLRFHTRYVPEAFICLQEVLHGQVEDVLGGLNLNARPGRAGGDEGGGGGCGLARAEGEASEEGESDEEEEWNYIGVGRSDGLRAGEYAPIFYRKGVWALEEFKTIWLSETPGRPSKGWDAASVRICTVGVFRARGREGGGVGVGVGDGGREGVGGGVGGDGGRKVVVLNTHLDDQGEVARREGARLIVEEVGRRRRTMQMMRMKTGTAGGAVVLAGDFNSEVDGDAYRVIVEEGGMSDVRELVPREERYGHEDTFTGFRHKESGSSRLDFLFLAGSGDEEDEDEGDGRRRRRKKGPWEVRGYGVLENRFDDGVYCSDHRAVVGDLVLL
ncbi:hypothetical protein MMC24_006579 [Lignoscripta atroalba]|nr:hypothetical protein [Lignoscripta atroalba]